MIESIPFILFAVTFLLLLSGFPVALVLSGTSLLFAGTGIYFGVFDSSFLSAFPQRIFGVMTNETLIAIPLFVFMGVILERSKISEDLLETMSKLFSKIRGGLGISVCLVGGLLAASTGIVGATVVTMGLISLPTMLNKGYSPKLSTGVICASGTLGQIIPPSIVLIILGDVISTANQQAQLALGNWSPSSVSVGDLFMGALVPGIILMLLYMLYVVLMAFVSPEAAPRPSGKVPPITFNEVTRSFLPPLVLIISVLGSILWGIATPTEAASVGAMGALFLSKSKKTLDLKSLSEAMDNTASITAMVFLILIGANLFSLVFRGYGGDETIQGFLSDFEGSRTLLFLGVMLLIFFLGFFLDFFEITFVVVPIVGPILLQLGFDPIWLGVMIALNLQTSFLTPPFGFSLFYLRGVTPKSVKTGDIYRGVLPFIVIQLLLLTILWFFPELSLWLPENL